MWPKICVNGAAVVVETTRKGSKLGRAGRHNLLFRDLLRPSSQTSIPISDCLVRFQVKGLTAISDFFFFFFFFVFHPRTHPAVLIQVAVYDKSIGSQIIQTIPETKSTALVIRFPLKLRLKSILLNFVYPRIASLLLPES